MVSTDVTTRTGTLLACSTSGAVGAMRTAAPCAGAAPVTDAAPGSGTGLSTGSLLDAVRIHTAVKTAVQPDSCDLTDAALGFAVVAPPPRGAPV